MPPPDQIATILVATDFSETGDAGIAWGAQLARAHGARLVLCHALQTPTPVAPASEFIPLPARFYDDLRAAAESCLERSAAELRATGLAATTVLRVGTAAEAVLAEVQKVGADLLVAGTRGLTGWKKLLLGSTTARLVRRSTCPVLTVHPEDAGRHREIRTVLIPTDFSEDAALAADAAARVVARGRASRIVLFHAYHVPVEHVAPLGVPLVLEAIAQVEASAHTAMEEAAARLRAHGLEVETKILEGYPPEAIVDQARGLGADLIAMGTHGRSGVKRLILGSTAERVLPVAPCPVLTLHREPQG